MRTLAFAAWLVHVAVLASALVPPACATACDDEDDGDEDCSPRCPTCTCAHAQKPLVLVDDFALEPRAGESRRVESTPAERHADPEPRGIFHPPRV